MAHNLIYKPTHYQLNSLNFVYDENGIMTSCIFYNSRFHIDRQRKIFNNWCPCVGGLFIYNPYQKGNGLKLELSTGYPWFPMLFLLYQYYLLDNWFESVHLIPNSEQDFVYIIENEPFRFNLNSFLRNLLITKKPRYVQKSKKNRS